MSLGNKLKTLRKNQKITQNELANLLNTTQDSISLWELNKRNPDIEQLKTLANFFNVSINYLLGLEDDLGNIIIQDNLNKNEKELIAYYKDLNQTKKERLIEFAKILSKQKDDKNIKEI